MRNSCNGCRVLRKGCTEDCIIRPCLQWIRSSEAQANVTLFLAKFYGRAGLLNLIGSGPEKLRPAIFQSLLYEACGRIVNPVHGSVGLMWSGSWHLCQAAVESVLSGNPISQIAFDATGSIPVPPLRGSDIRHVAKDASGPAAETHMVCNTRARFKRTGQPAHKPGSGPAESNLTMETGEASNVSQAGPDRTSEDVVTLDLNLGLAPPVCLG